MAHDWELALAVLVVGTWLLRALPLWWTRRHLQQRSNAHEPVLLPLWLQVAGPMMIAAMLGVSLVPSTLSWSSVAATIAGVLTTAVVWRYRPSLGWPVLAGVVVFGVVTASRSVLGAL